MSIGYWTVIPKWYDIDFQIKLLGALSVGDVRTGTIPSLLPSQKHYLKVYRNTYVLCFVTSVTYSGQPRRLSYGEIRDPRP
ncbi:MAG: hypothetical protein V1736_03985 [Pseudomonadota bacterium]